MDVKALQTFLAKNEFNPGAIDGIAGDRTKAAFDRMSSAVMAWYNDGVGFEAPNRAVTRVFIHCSASDIDAHDDISVMRRWHLDRGWSDVGYHYFIKKDGTIQKGRDLELTPAAQKDHNSGTIAICLHGLEKYAFTKAQFESLWKLCGEIKRAYNGGVTFHGHREVSNRTCPVFDYKAVLGLDDNGVMYEWLRYANRGYGTALLF